MQGTVTRVRKRGVEALMDTPGEPTGRFKVVRQSDAVVLGTVTFRKMRGTNTVNLNWDPELRSAPVVAIGDLVQPVIG